MVGILYSVSVNTHLLLLGWSGVARRDLGGQLSHSSLVECVNVNFESPNVNKCSSKFLNIVYCSPQLVVVIVHCTQVWPKCRLWRRTVNSVYIARTREFAHAGSQ